MPAILMTRRLAKGEALQHGAAPGVDLVDLHTYLGAIEGLDISIVSDTANA